MIHINNNKHWLQEDSLFSNEESIVSNNSIQVTYKQLLVYSKQASSYFIECGINQNDHVAIVSENSIEFIIVVNALWFIGAIPLPLNTRESEIALNRLINNSNCKLLININDTLKVDLISPSIRFNLNLLNSKNEITNVFKYIGTKTALLMFTSGSSGIAKCVELSFSNLYESVKLSDSIIEHSIEDKWLASLPFYHIGGFLIIIRALLSGCSITIPSSFRYSDIAKSILTQRPSLVSMVPTMLYKFINSKFHFEKSLRFLFIGGGPASNKLISRALEMQYPICRVYGSTETSSMVTASISTENNIFSSGKALHGVEISIVDAENKIVSNNKLGKIKIKSNSIASKYYYPKENNNLKNGYFFTSDIGKIDEGGNLIVLGRKDDIIISGGEKVSLGEVEEVLLEESIVSDCKAYKVNDEKWGESYILIVESNNESENTVEYINNYLKERLGNYKYPQKIYSITKIIRNDVGKINKEKLKEIINRYDF